MRPTKPRRRFIFSLRALFAATIIAAIATKALTSIRMEALLMLLTIWAMHVALAILPSLPILYFGRNRAKWQWFDSLALVIPFLVWVSCTMVFDRSKSMANFVECYMISIAILLAAAARVALSYRKNQWIYSTALILTLCLVAIGIYLLIPSLPE